MTLRQLTRLSSKMVPRINVAVVGGGRMGKIRAREVFACLDTKLSCIIDSSSQKCAQDFGEQFHCPGYTSLEEALDKSSSTGRPIDAVWIATPTFTHPELIAQAANAGKPVGVEKPVAVSIADTQASFNVCDKNGVPLYVSFQRRIDPSYVGLAGQVRTGTLGNISSIRCTFRDHPVPDLEFLKKGGDIFYDLAVHDVDYALWLLQEYPNKVYATASSVNPELQKHGIPDSAHALLTFPSGAVVSLEMTRCSAYGYDNRVEVAGELGMLRVENRRQTALVSSTAIGELHDRPDHSFPQRFAQAYADEVADFAQVIKGMKLPPLTCLDCCKSTRIVELASLSAKEGATRVIPPFADDVTMTK